MENIRSLLQNQVLALMFYKLVKYILGVSQVSDPLESWPPPQCRGSGGDAKLLKVVQEVDEESIIKAATEIVDKKQNLSSDIVKCGISVDSTWQRRGYTSMNGCVAAISVDTGKVLDIEVMSSYCPTCKRLQTMPRNFEYESSKADHICQCNFTGSSSKMEIVGASRIFLRSEKNRRLHYTQYYGMVIQKLS
ncbi:uncharacterized protein TNCV_682911 [Trichonephila clavipes]|nr:uncharacterized protein TNCV_682911 [Trichonephila clavipes]